VPGELVSTDSHVDGFNVANCPQNEEENRRDRLETKLHPLENVVLIGKAALAGLAVDASINLKLNRNIFLGQEHLNKL
jgi:hypothetical protein